MSDKPIALEVDCSTGVVKERYLTEEEIAQREADIAAYLAEQEELAKEKALTDAAKQSAQEKLKSLGLNDIEVAAITNI